MSALVTARHEFLMTFRSIYGWVTLALLTAVSGYYLYVACEYYLNLALQTPDHDLGVSRVVGAAVIGTLNQLLLFLTPLLTAVSISSEHKNHTIVLLQSSPISSWEIVLGKFLAYWAYYLVILSVAVLMVLGLLWFNSLDFGQLASVILGSVLLLATYVAIGIYCSSLSKSYFTSAIICLILLMVLSFVLNAVVRDYPWLEWFIISRHSSSFYIGEVDTRHIAYFLLSIFTFLFLANQRLESARTS